MIRSISIYCVPARRHILESKKRYLNESICLSFVTLKLYCCYMMQKEFKHQQRLKTTWTLYDPTSAVEATLPMISQLYFTICVFSASPWIAELPKKTSPAGLLSDNLSVHRWFAHIDAPPHAKAYRRWSRTRPPQEMKFGNPFCLTCTVGVMMSSEYICIQYEYKCIQS